MTSRRAAGLARNHNDDDAVDHDRVHPFVGTVTDFDDHSKRGMIRMDR